MSNNDTIKSTTVYTNNANEQVALQVRRNAKGLFYVSLENGVRLSRTNFRTMSSAARQRTELGHSRTQACIDYARKNGVTDRTAKVIFKMQVV